MIKFWKHMTYVALVMALLGACQSSGDSNSKRGFGDQEISLLETHPEAQATAGWLNPKTLQIEVSSTPPLEDDMYIEGILVGWKFVALTDVKGQLQAPPVKPRCDRVWLVLEDRSIKFQDDGATPPERTYIAGYLDPETTLFYPETASIVRLAPPVTVEEE